MSGIPVVDYARMERLRPPEVTSVQMNLNTLCIVFIIITVLGLYNRSVTISQRRERFYT
jgi:hypothetical protein